METDCLRARHCYVIQSADRYTNVKDHLRRDPAASADKAQVEASAPRRLVRSRLSGQQHHHHLPHRRHRILSARRDWLHHTSGIITHRFPHAPRGGHRHRMYTSLPRDALLRWTLAPFHDLPHQVMNYLIPW